MRMMLRKKIEFVLEKINNAHVSDEDFFSNLEDALLDFNLERFDLSILYGKNNNFDSFFSYGSCPQELVDHYSASQYYLCDPLFYSLHKLAMPFEWDIQKFDDLLPIQKKLMNLYSSFNIKSGTTIPLSPHSNFQGFVRVLNTSLHPEFYTRFLS
ncbi:MAG: autoinducer binding domain-containing protein [Alphaproteobacteria bacterium]|jgi:hypothetical protein|nr:autoinducer binding domain-containing protein [Alphaproteobacteria bacterium]